VSRATAGRPHGGLDGHRQSSFGCLDRRARDEPKRTALAERVAFREPALIRPSPLDLMEGGRLARTPGHVAARDEAGETVTAPGLSELQ
jgi:hypothetical protein